MREYPGADDRTVARGAALTTSSLREQTFRDRLIAGIQRFKLAPNEQLFLNLIYSSRRFGRSLYWSNRFIRRASAEAMIDAFLDDLATHPERRRWLATFAWDDGIVMEAEPAVDIVAMKAKVYKAMRQYGLEGVGVVEVDTTTHIAGRGRLLLFHIHFYGWATGGKFSPVAVAADLMASGRFPNSLGAPSVVFKRVSNYEISIARIAGYLTKFPPGAKNRVERRNNPGRYALRGTLAGFVPGAVVRLAEVMSHLDARDVIFGVGPGGSRLRKAWYKRFIGSVRAMGPQRGRRNETAFDEGECWVRIRLSNGSKRMKPCRIITRTSERQRFATIDARSKNLAAPDDVFVQASVSM